MPEHIALLNLPSAKCQYVAKLKNLSVTFALLFGLGAHAAMVETDDPDVLSSAEQSEFGWVPQEKLPASLRAKIPPGCRGLYIEAPQTTAASEAVDLDTLPLVVQADDASVVDGNRATLAGNVRVSQGDRSIAAGKMAYERDIDQAVLEDQVVIRQPGILIRGERAEVSTTQHKASFDEATFVLKDRQIRGSAQSIKQVSRSKIELRGGSVTSCEPGDESWMLEGELLTVDRETNQGTGRHVRLKVGSVPIFYLPYITFPLGDERKSGFLFPSVSSSDGGGLDVSVPYYWNLAPNYDATLTPRFISGRGTMLEFETRYLNRWMRNEINLAVLPDDGGSNDDDLDDLIEEGTITEQQARPYKGSNRWLAQLDLDGGATAGWYARADYTRVSDEDYFRDLGTSSFSVANETFLNQLLEVGYQFEHWQIASRAQNQQVLLLDVDDPYRKLPQVDIDGRYNFNHWIAVLDNRYTQFRRGENRPEILNGNRLNTSYRLRWEKRYPWGFFIPEIGHKSIQYNLEESPAFGDDDRRFSLSTPQASLDSGLVFEHSAGRVTQTIEPRIYYLYRRYVDHAKLFDIGGNSGVNINFDTSERTFAYGQLYRDSRFIGGDRLDDADQVTLGLTSRWLNNHSGRDLFTASVGQIFHFRDRRVTLEGTSGISETEDSSEFASELTVNLGARTQLNANAIYDTESRRINRGSASINFASTDYQKLFNIAYSFLRDLDASSTEDVASKDIDQVDVSFALPVARQWSLMGRANYDFQNRQELETFVGFEYNDCCYRFRFLARRWLDSNVANLTTDKDAQYDTGVFFEIHFKGLGGSGAKVNSILNDGIFGYETREQFLQ